MMKQHFGPQHFGNLFTLWRGHRPYALSKRAISRMKCIDCGMNTVEAGDWYMCPHEIWIGELGLGKADKLCFDCLEERLERPLRPYFFRPGLSSPLNRLKLQDRRPVPTGLTKSSMMGCPCRKVKLEHIDGVGRPRSATNARAPFGTHHASFCSDRCVLTSL
jgi:hypothetical protein